MTTGRDVCMSEDRLGEAVVIEEVISLWAAAESGSRSKAKSKAADKSARSTQARAESTVACPSAAFGADGSVRSTRAVIEGMTPKELGELAEAEFLRRAL